MNGTTGTSGERRFGTCVCLRKIGQEVSCTGGFFGQLCDGWEPEELPEQAS